MTAGGGLRIDRTERRRGPLAGQMLIRADLGRSRAFYGDRKIGVCVVVKNSDKRCARSPHLAWTGICCGRITEVLATTRRSGTSGIV
jgi:hypothetical protein